MAPGERGGEESIHGCRKAGEVQSITLMKPGVELRLIVEIHITKLSRLIDPD